MSSLNRINYGFTTTSRITTITTHEGAVVPGISPEKQLRRLVMACMLWEKSFYVEGVTSAKKIAELVVKVPADVVSALAIEARTTFKLRHVPLLLCRELARTGKLTSVTLAGVIKRPDEMAEFLSIYWAERRTPLANQIKKGLAQAFGTFNEYQLAKWDKGSAAISIRDVMFMVHPKPQNPEQTSLFERIANKQLKTPDTWETELSAGADKAATFSRLMKENKLGALAFLRNLRNMTQAGVPETLIRDYSVNLNVDNVLPFRYVAAARIVPQLEDMLEAMMLRSLGKVEKLPGKTIFLVDVSGSMFGTKLSAKSDLDRFDAAAALTMLGVEMCESVEVYTFSNQLVRVAPRKGFALLDVLKNSQHNGGTDLANALERLNYLQCTSDRLIVVTDEQVSAGRLRPQAAKPYLLNVGSYENGINRSEWTAITGFSESVFTYIRESEKD